MSTWPHWQHQFLHVADLPQTDHNSVFLGYWSQYASSNCDRNPIDVSHRVAGSTRCHLLPGGRYARNYATRDDAATAFGVQLMQVEFALLHEALLTGSPGAFPDLSAVEDQLRLWGSPRFADWFKDAAAKVGTQGGRGSFVFAHSRNVAGAWSALMRALAVDGHRTIVELDRSTANLRRIERRLRRV